MEKKVEYKRHQMAEIERKLEENELLSKKKEKSLLRDIERKNNKIDELHAILDFKSSKME